MFLVTESVRHAVNMRCILTTATFDGGWDTTDEEVESGRILGLVYGID